VTETCCLSQEAKETGISCLNSVSRQRTREHGILSSGNIANYGIPVVQQPPYTHDMAPCDFWMFPKLKVPLKGRDLTTLTPLKRI
jgi:hypothetical protein